MTTTLNRWNPVRQVVDLQQNLLSTFRPAAVFYPLSDETLGSQSRPSWTPAMDVTENEKGYLISAELPGMRKADITVMLEQDVITVRGERKPTGTSEEGGNTTWHVNERSFGCFDRSISLSKDVDASSLQAELKDGILSLRLTKKQEALPRLVEIS
jgi:HSP20 family protein